MNDVELQSNAISVPVAQHTIRYRLRFIVSQLLLTAVIMSVFISGCARTRHQHRSRADCEANLLLDEKSEGRPWDQRPQYSVYPDAASRWHQPGCPDCPELPEAAPQLYSYQLPLAPDNDTTEKTLPADSQGEDPEATDEPVVAAIPPTAWQDIPLACRDRMFDFASLREEADRTFEQFESKIEASPTEGIPRLDLREIVDLALLNSRDYQSQKENLYRVSLQLSLERYDYLLFPTPNGNGTTGEYSHNRNGGITVDNLSASSRVALQKALVTGGDVLASFANNMLLTFNGPQGFAADVSSELLFEFTQPLLQRDIQFESLTQAERNLVYAARDFARFRKEFFVDFADSYYGIIRAYRQIEIDSQNYFSLVRAFNQAEAEYRAGLVPRFQVDQVEQNLLSGRGALIGTCNGVEQSLDSLKLTIGIPTETPINIDLTELDELTLNDQLAVSADLINRVQRRLRRTLDQPQPERIELLSTGVVLIDRILDASKIRETLKLEPLVTDSLRDSRARLLVESARVSAEEIETSLRRELDSESPSLPVIFQRALALADAFQRLLERQFELSDELGEFQKDLAPIRQSYQLGVKRKQELAKGLQAMIQQEQMEQLPQLVREAENLRTEMNDLVNEVDQLQGSPQGELSADSKLNNAVEQATSLLSESQQILEQIGTALQPINIDVDNAMITALVLRFDLMNQRGVLADDWRQIKLAADELRSILDLRASQRIGTDPGNDNPFDFTFDESRTSLRLTFDAPLNRLAQRNAYRFSLISYQASIRNLGGLEDNIKFAVRNDLRNLALGREQYLIAVASAALAFERVVSTSLEFRLGTGGVSARDFLEAQTAYTDALSAVASRHIDYILDRSQLFLDMELLEVNESGFWDELYLEDFEPTLYLELPAWASPVYGTLPDVDYSESIRGPMMVQPGQPMIFREPINRESTEIEAQDFGLGETFPRPEFEPELQVK